MNEPCAVTADLNKYLHQLDEDERLADAIEDRASELFASDFRHDTFAAISEAMGEATGETAEAIAKAARMANLEALGRAVLTCSASYWEALARKQATEEVQAEWNSCCCHGRGCSKCFDDQGD
jgi:hypothetical protein